MIRWGDEIVPGDLIELDWDGKNWTDPVKARCLAIDADGWFQYELIEDTRSAKAGYKSACQGQYVRRAAE